MKILKLTVLVFLLIVTFAISAAEIDFSEEEKQFIKAHPVIRVHNETNWPPFNFNENGMPGGFSIDYMNMLAKNIGVKVEYVSGPSWNEFLDMMRTGKLDVMLNIVKTPERQQYLLFTPPYADNPNSILSKKSKPYTSIESLFGKTVAVPKGFFTEEVIRKNYPKINLLPVKNMLATIKAVSFGQADAALGEQAVFNHLLNEHMMSDLSISGEAILGDPEFALLNIATRKDLPVLASILTKGVKSISRLENKALQRKWLFQTSKDRLVLTQQETAFLKSHPLIRVHNETNWPPFNFNENGIPRGYSIDYMNLIAKNIGVKVEYVSGPSWNEFLEMMRTGKLDVMLNIVKTPERQQFLLYTPPYADNPNSILSKKDRPYASIESLFGKTVAVPKGFFTEEIIRKNYPKIDLLPVKNVFETMKAVSSGEADAALGELAVFNYLLLEHKMSDLAISGEAIMGDPEFSLLNIATRKDRPILADILTKSINSITREEKIALQQKWLFRSPGDKGIQFTNSEKRYLENKKVIKICVDPDWMPFESIDDKNHYSGIGSELTKNISQQIGIPIVLVPTSSWKQTLASIQQHRCDILPMVVRTPNRETYMDFTDPYIDESIVIATKEDKFFVQDSRDLTGKRVGIVSGFAFAELLAQKNPDIEFVNVDNVEEGLGLVQNGELFGYVDALPSIAYVIQNSGMLDLKIAGRLEFDMQLRVASRNDEPLLNAIMQKALNAIGKDQIRTIVGKWISIKVEQSFDYRRLIYITLFFLAIVLTIIYKNRSIRLINAELKSSYQSIEEKNRQLHELAVTDNLTRLFNRNRLDEALNFEASHANRYASDFGLIILDIDHFKEVNDVHGHATGDRILQEFAKILKTNARATDVVGRWGGEEFLIVCSRTGLDGIMALAENLKEKISAYSFPTIGQMTASFGVSLYQKDEPIDALLKRADAALYNAKERGRNRVESL